MWLRAWLLRRRDAVRRSGRLRAVVGHDRAGAVVRGLRRADRVDREALDDADLGAGVAGVVAAGVAERHQAGTGEPALLDRRDDARPGRVLTRCLQRLSEGVRRRHAVLHVAVE